MHMKTRSEIESEIAALEAVKLRIPHTTAFGDSNHDAIDAQVEVLQEEMTEDDIYEKWPDDTDMHTRTAAQEAQQWMDGESEDVPSADWATIAK